MTRKYRQTEFGPIPEDWELKIVKEVCEINTSSIGKDYPHEEIEYIDITSVDKGTILESKNIKLNEAPSRAKRIVKDSDIILSTVRPNLKHFAFIKNAKPNLVVSTGFAVITCTNIVPQYLYYFLTTDSYTNFLSTIAEGHTSAYPAINPDVIENSIVPYPTIKEQQTIAKILSDFDAKIGLNRQINQTLEQIAQAIFKSWFVDFDPVKAKIEAKEKGEDPERAAMCAISGKTDEDLKQLSPEQLEELSKTAALFPDEFEESELGLIPKGWTIESIENLSTHVAMGPFGSNIKVSTFVNNGIPIISGKHLNGTLLEDYDYNFITDKHADKLLSSNVYRGDIVFTHAGNIGQVAYIPDHSKYERYVLSQRQFYMRTDTTKISPLFIIYYFKSDIGQHNLLANTSQVGVPSISRPVSNLKKIKLIVPQIKLSDDFDKVIRALHSKISNNVEQSKILELVRDTLLPKLLTGDISTK